MILGWSHLIWLWPFYFQFAIHAAQGEFVEAAAESAGFLAGLVAAGLVTGVGGAIAGVIGSPVWATAVVAGAAGAAGFIVGDYVEGQFPGLVDEFSDFFQEDFYGGSGSPGGGGWDWPGLDPCDFDFNGECLPWP
jgi:hypothetical protein